MSTHEITPQMQTSGALNVIVIATLNSSRRAAKYAKSHPFLAHVFFLFRQADGAIKNGVKTSPRGTMTASIDNDGKAVRMTKDSCLRGGTLSRVERLEFQRRLNLHAGKCE